MIVPGSIDLEPLGKLVTGHKCELVAVIVSVAVPTSVEIVKLPLGPGQGVVRIHLSLSVAVAEVKLGSLQYALPI